MPDPTLSVETIAEMAHEANRVYGRTLGEVHLPWSATPPEHRESCIAGVLAILAKDVTSPSDSHKRWMDRKLANGWRHGPDKHVALKTHPCLVPFDDLPPEQRTKDHIFFNLVTALLTIGGTK